MMFLFLVMSVNCIDALIEPSKSLQLRFFAIGKKWRKTCSGRKSSVKASFITSKCRIEKWCYGEITLHHHNASTF